MRSRSLSRAESRPTTPMDSTVPAISTPMISSTTRISISVKPLIARGLFVQVPVANVGIGLLAAGLAVGAQRVDIHCAVSARAFIDIVMTPGILAHALHIAFFPPVRQCRIGRLVRQRVQSLFGG